MTFFSLFRIPICDDRCQGQDNKTFISLPQLNTRVQGISIRRWLTGIRARICKRLRRPGGIDSSSLCSLAGRYDKQGCRNGPPGLESIPGLLKRFTNTGSRCGKKECFDCWTSNLFSPQQKYEKYGYVPSVGMLYSSVFQKLFVTWQE